MSSVVERIVYKGFERWDPPAGSQLEDSIGDAFDRVKETGLPCFLTFNGVELPIVPGVGPRSYVIKHSVAAYNLKRTIDAEEEREGRKFDTAKLRYDLMPMDALDEIAKRFTHGAEKYAPGNWQTVDNAVDRYSAALMRHYSAYRQGERTDPEAPGLSHIGAVAWNALVLVWFELRGYEPEGDKNTE